MESVIDFSHEMPYTMLAFHGIFNGIICFGRKENDMWIGRVRGRNLAISPVISYLYGIAKESGCNKLRISLKNRSYREIPSRVIERKLLSLGFQYDVTMPGDMIYG